MTTSRSIDLASLPAPAVVEALDYEAIRTAMIADFRAREPGFDAVLESDPAIKVLEAAAYREMLLRQRVNDAARAVLVAFAQEADLDHLGVLVGVTRMEGETDERLRHRIVLAHEGHAGTGTRGGYQYHIMSANAHVQDVTVRHAGPGRVEITVLPFPDKGDFTDAEMKGLRDAVGADTVRNVTDQVTVRRATRLPFDIAAVLYLYDGPDADVVLRTVRQSLDAYLRASRRLGRDITLSALYDALHGGGVQRVELTAPTGRVVVDDRSVAEARHITLTFGGRDD